MVETSPQGLKDDGFDVSIVKLRQLVQYTLAHND